MLNRNYNVNIFERIKEKTVLVTNSGKISFVNLFSYFSQRSII